MAPHSTLTYLCPVIRNFVLFFYLRVLLFFLRCSYQKAVLITHVALLAVLILLDFINLMRLPKRRHYTVFSHKLLSSRGLSSCILLNTLSENSLNLFFLGQSPYFKPYRTTGSSSVLCILACVLLNKIPEDRQF